MGRNDDEENSYRITLREWEDNWKQKKETLDRIRWRTGCGRYYAPLVRDDDYDDSVIS